jgi:hypothetical protein
MTLSMDKALIYAYSTIALLVCALAGYLGPIFTEQGIPLYDFAAIEMAKRPWRNLDYIADHFHSDLGYYFDPVFWNDPSPHQTYRFLRQRHNNCLLCVPPFIKNKFKLGSNILYIYGGPKCIIGARNSSFRA